MTTRVTIPASIDDAIGKLEGIESLLTAKGWERAAIVYAFTEERPAGNQPRQMANSRHLSISDFADLGIAGLRTRDTVRRYRNAWIAGGGDPNIKPGDNVELPEGDFPPEKRQPRIEVSPGSSPDTAVQAIKTMNLEQRTAALRALVSDDAIAGERKAEAVLLAMSDQYVTEEVATFIASSPVAMRRLEKAMRTKRNREIPEIERTTETLSDGWRKWLNAMNALLERGARLAERSDVVELDTYDALAYAVYRGITEKKIDAEIRDLFDREGVH